VVPFQAGLAPPVRESAPQATSTVPFAWFCAVGTAWHSAQATARLAPPERWTWWAPTAREVVATSPRVPVGGAAFAADPWQELQVIALTSSVPFRWSVPLTVVFV
jgi:hypothetical protein